MHSAIPARLLVGDTHAYILTDCKGCNPVPAPRVGGNVPLVTVDMGCSPHLEVAVRPYELGDISYFINTVLWNRNPGQFVPLYFSRLITDYCKLLKHYFTFFFWWRPIFEASFVL